MVEGDRVPAHVHGFGDVPTGTGEGQYPSGSDVAAMITMAPNTAPFVATNEYYIDLLAAVDAARRIYPSVGAAITVGQGAFPAGTTIVARLREDQAHVWDPVDVGQEYLGTHPLVIRSARSPQYQRFNGDFTLTINSPGPAAGGESVTFKDVSLSFSAPFFFQDWLDTTLVFENVYMRNNTGAAIILQAQGIWVDVAKIDGVQLKVVSPGAVAGEGLHVERATWISGLLINESTNPLFDSNANAEFKDVTIHNYGQQWIMFRGTGVANYTLQNVAIHTQNGVGAACAFFDVPVASLNGISDVRVNLEDIMGPVTWGLPAANTSGAFWLVWQGAQPADLPANTWYVSGGAVIPKP